ARLTPSTANRIGFMRISEERSVPAPLIGNIAPERTQAGIKITLITAWYPVDELIHQAIAKPTPVKAIALSSITAASNGQLTAAKSIFASGASNMNSAA